MLEGRRPAAVACAHWPRRASALAEHRVRLVILDVLLPDGDGVDLLAGDPRDAGGARHGGHAAVDRSRGPRPRPRAETGADEYVGKPYDPSYLVGARPRARAPRQTACARRQAGADRAGHRRQRHVPRGAQEPRSSRPPTAWSSPARRGGLRLAADLRPNAIVVDGVLPGIDGATVIRRIRLDAALRRRAVRAPHRLAKIAAPKCARSMPARTRSCARTRTSTSSSRGSTPCCAAPATQVDRPRHRKPARPEEGARGGRQRNLPPGAGRGAPRGGLRGRSRALRRGSPRASRRSSPSTASCSIS